MAPEERALLAPTFNSSRYAVVFYSRTVQAFNQSTGQPIGPAHTLAMNEAAPVGIDSITNLTLSLTITYDRESPCCYWDIQGLFNWTGTPPLGSAGKDQIGVAWANGQALVPGSDGGVGTYMHGAGNIAFNNNDAVPNAGTDWEFDECKYSSCYYYADWGELLATMYYNYRRYQPTNVVLKYYHTYQDYQYSVSISSSPGISITPTTGTQSTVQTGLFTN